MKKIFYLIAAVGLTWGISSCDNEPKNPGDFSIKPELSIGDFISTVSGETLPITYENVFDTIFQYDVVLYDSIFNEAGEFEKRVAVDTIVVPATFTTKWYRAATINLPCDADTFNLAVFSNSRWKCPTPETSLSGDNSWPSLDAPAQWGGGDSEVKVRFGYNKYAFPVKATMYMHTSDSTIFYQIPFIQASGK